MPDGGIFQRERLKKAAVRRAGCRFWHALFAPCRTGAGNIAVRLWKGDEGMLTSLNRMVGLPVIWQDRQMGYVERAVPDARVRRLSGVVVRRGIGGAKWVAAEAIALVGSRCVLVRQKPAAMPDDRPESPERAFLTTGECAGEVTDIILRSDTLHLKALELSPGPLYRLLGRCAYAPEYRAGGGARAGEVVVPRLLTWAQLKRTLGEEDGG